MSIELNKSESAFVSKLMDASFGNAELMHEGGVMSVKKAYAGNVHFARACYNALRVKDRAEFAGFLKRYGLNVTKIDRTNFDIGGVLNPKNQRKHIEGAKADIAYFRLVDAHVPQRKSPKEDTRTPMQIAQQALEAAINRAEKVNPRAADIVREKINTPKWVSELMAFNVTDEEASMLIDALTELRLSKAA